MAKLHLMKLDDQLFGGQLLSALRFVAGWSVPVLYTALVSGLVYFFFQETYPKLSHPHPWLYYILLLMLASSFLLSVYTTAEAHTSQQLQRWQHDNLIFFPAGCETCHISRPARSRHCRYCGYCVVLYDHHCIWLNNCIGMGNYQWFYAFLAMNIVVMTYGLSIIVPVLMTNWRGIDELDLVRPELALTILLCPFDMLLVWFSHMNYCLVRDGMTTNEYSKWQIVHDLILDGMLYELHGQYYEYLEHEDVFVSVNQRDSKVRGVPRDLIRQVANVAEIRNIYDKGSFGKNLLERLDS